MFSFPDGLFSTVDVLPGIDLLMEWVATGAFHDSNELYDEPKLSSSHPRCSVGRYHEVGHVEQRW